MFKVGIFGCGHLGKLHLDHWKELAGVSIVGFIDPDEAAAAEVENTYALKRYTSEEKLINDSDIIDVACPTSGHFAICEKAIRKGKHVFVEKPMAHTMREAEQLVKLVRESSVKLQVGHVERFSPAFLSLKGGDLSPMLIEAHRLAPFDPGGVKVDVVLDLMIHDIDLVLNMVKSEVKHIAASGVAVFTDAPDIASARIEFNNGCVANLTASRISGEPICKMQLFQKDTSVAVDFLNKKTEITRKKEASGGSPQMVVTHPPVPEANALRQQLQEFLASIRHNRRTVVNEIDGYRAMEIAHQILKKITSNLSTVR